MLQTLDKHLLGKHVNEWGKARCWALSQIILKKSMVIRTSYIIGRVQCKMKMQDPSFKRLWRNSRWWWRTQDPSKCKILLDYTGWIWSWWWSWSKYSILKIYNVNTFHNEGRSNVGNANSCMHAGSWSGDLDSNLATWPVQSVFLNLFWDSKEEVLGPLLSCDSWMLR
jgi:hypothetical protein